MADWQHLSRLATLAADRDNPKARVTVTAIALASVLLSVGLAFITGYGHALAISMLAVIVVAWRWGVWGGMVPGVVIFLLSTTVMALGGHDRATIARDNLVFLAMTATIAFCFGVAGNLLRRLQLANEEIIRLRGLLPICAACKKIRDDSGSWQELETYITDHSGAQFSHGLCPECSHELYGDVLRAKAGDSES